MAVGIPGSILTDIRGSIGDVTYFRNRGGLCMRQRFDPPYPASAYRDALQQAIRVVSKQWSATLTEAQRTSWRNYAATHPWTNALGQVIQATGFQWYLRTNVVEYYYNENAAYATPPAGPPLHPPILTATMNVGLDQVTIPVPPTGYPAGIEIFRLWAFVSPCVNVGIQTYHRGFRIIGYNECFKGSWDSDPWTVAYPFTPAAGKAFWIRGFVQKNTGEISRSFQTRCTT